MVKLRLVNKMFKKAGVNPPAGLFSLSHFGLLIFFGAIAIIFFIFTKKWKKDKMLTFFKVYSLILFALEILKIIWNIANYGFNVLTLNRFLPLYYCSIFLYAFILLSWTKSIVQKASMTWMIYGGLIAGVSFLIYPSSSLLEYPFYHFLSLHSIMFHASLVLVSILLLRHEFYEPSTRDFLPFVYFSLLFMITALLVNKIWGTNLMFLETPLAIGPFIWLNNLSPIIFQIFIFLAQLFLPFVFTHWIFLFFSRFTNWKIYKSDTKETTNSDIE